MSNEITAAELRVLMHRAVAEKGEDYIYPKIDVPESDYDENFAPEGCVYFDPVTAAPSCLLGHVFAYKGLTLDNMNSPAFCPCGDCEPESLNAAGIKHVIEQLFPDTREEVADAMFAAQRAQDGGVLTGQMSSEPEPWGVAVCKAEKILDEAGL